MVIYFKGKKWDTDDANDYWKYVLKNYKSDGFGRHWNDCFYIKFNKKTKIILKCSIIDKKLVKWGRDLDSLDKMIDAGKWIIVSEEEALAELK